MFKQIALVLVTTASLIATPTKTKEQTKVVNNFTVEVSCVNECFDLLDGTGNFNRAYVNQCLLTCGISDTELEDKVIWQDRELNRLENKILKMKKSKYLNKPFICVD